MPELTQLIANANMEAVFLVVALIFLLCTMALAGLSLDNFTFAKEERKRQREETEALIRMLKKQGVRKAVPIALLPEKTNVED